jgi:hypothetical protein
MYPAWICALLLAVTPACADELTIVLDFEGQHTDQSVAEMKREFEGIMKGSSLTFDWKSRSQAEQIASDNLVVVRFNGACVLKPIPYLYDERGPMAFSYSTSGSVQPFSEVACDRVARAVRSALPGGDCTRADLLMGRALGRVLAHEVVHMLTKSRLHGRTGLAKTTLSGPELIAPELRLDAQDLKRLRVDH